MKKIYSVKVEKRDLGGVVELVLPNLKGTVVATVIDMETNGENRIFVVDCKQAEHKANITMEGVEALTKEKGIKLATKYQPERKVKRHNRRLRRVEEITIPKCDLEVYLK